MGTAAQKMPRELKVTWVGNVALTLLVGCISELLAYGAPHHGALATSAWIAGATGTSIAIAIVPFIIAAVGKFRSPGVYLILLQIMFFFTLRGQALIGNIHGIPAAVVSNNAATPAPMKPRETATRRVAREVARLTAYQLATEKANWRHDEADFEYRHPDIEVGNNLKLVQEQINRLPVGDMTNAEILSRAYVSAQSDPRWKLEK